MRADVIGPRLAAALHLTGNLPDEDLPMLAAHWLADGHDGPALCELAGLQRDDQDVHLMLDWGVELRCRGHREVLSTTYDEWVCGSTPAHSLGVLGELRRHDVSIES